MLKSLQRTVLPPEYREVSWLIAKSGSGAYIDTGYYVKYESTLSCRVKGGNYHTSKGITFFGECDETASTYSGGTILCVVAYQGNRICAYNGSNRILAGPASSYYYQKDVVMDITISPTTLTVDYPDHSDWNNEQSCVRGTVGNMQYPIFLFGKNVAGTPNTTQNDYVAFHRFEALEDNHNVVSLIPCVRVYDDKPGMYDTVSGVFFTNAGTNEFTWEE